MYQNTDTEIWEDSVRHQPHKSINFNFYYKYCNTAFKKS